MSNLDWQKIELRFQQPASSNMTGLNDVFPGIAEQTDGTWALLVDCPGGALSQQQFSTLAEIVADGGLGVKLTGRQAPVLLLPKDKIAPAEKKLKDQNMRVSFIHGSLRNVKACIGAKGCKNSRAHDSMEIAQEIDHNFYGVILPWDFKVAVSGCSRNCASAACQSLGLIESREGFDLYLGGTENTNNPSHGTLVASHIRREKIIDVVSSVLKCYVWAVEELKKAGRISTRPNFSEIFSKMGKEFFVEAVSSTLGRNDSSVEAAATCPETAADHLPGFNKENIFSAFLTLDKLCTNCPNCRKFNCHLFIAKETLGEAARTGRKFLKNIPSDMMDVIHTLPLHANKFEQFKLMDAFHNISEVCDQCQISDHDPLCSVNIALTSIGCLISGREYLSPKDLEQKRLST